MLTADTENHKINQIARENRNYVLNHRDKTFSFTWSENEYVGKFIKDTEQDVCIEVEYVANDRLEHSYRNTFPYNEISYLAIVTDEGEMVAHQQLIKDNRDFILFNQDRTFSFTYDGDAYTGNFISDTKDGAHIDATNKRNGSICKGTFLYGRMSNLILIPTYNKNILGGKYE